MNGLGANYMEMNQTFDVDLKLPKLISDGMIIQENSPVRIWGWAIPGRTVSVTFREKQFDTTADDNGRWFVVISPMQAGGPYSMIVRCGNLMMTVNNILVGEVWVCSGQSNMALQMDWVKDLYANDVVSCENNMIRQFLVPLRYDFNSPKEDLESGHWALANPENILEFTAVGYFFAKELYKKFHVPVGLINSSVCGSPAESWISEKSLGAFPDKFEELEICKDSKYIEKTMKEDADRIPKWHEQLHDNDKGFKDPTDIWYSKDYDASSWPRMQIPSYWEDEGLDFQQGSIWFRRKINVPASMTGVPAKIYLGAIVDSDDVYINGRFVGSTDYQYPPRKYDVPKDVLVEGENVVAVRVVSDANKGGFVKGKLYQLVADNQVINLSGEWRYCVGAVADPLVGRTFFEWKPCGLFNGMIAPLFNYTVKGVLWYQGESNCDKPEEYYGLLRSLITEWRENWKVSELPFVYVQLPNFVFPDKAVAESGKSKMAVLREAQLRMLELKDTAMAVTIDIGEWNDLHPSNKKEVGRRLALAAQKAAYHDNTTVSMGPIYKSMSMEDGKIILSFSNRGSGLECRGSELRQFAITNEDGKFTPAYARIVGDKVIVWNESVRHPTAVSYAWADDPEGANLYNKEGLPASPFRSNI